MSKLLFLTYDEQLQLLMLVRRELDDTYPRPHRGTLDKIESLHKLKRKLT